MLHEGHVHFAEIRSHYQLPIFHLLGDRGPDPAIHAVAKGFGIGVGVFQIFVFVGFETGNIAGGFLIQIDIGESAI